MSATRTTLLAPVLIPVLAALWCSSCTSQPAAVEGVAGQRGCTGPSWMKKRVTGTRVPRCKDASDQAIAESPVIVVTKEQLEGQPGLSVEEKLKVPGS
jgi:hypothetical protein